MNQTKLKFSPLNASERIDSLDVIRGIALLGILLMNINGMGLPFSYSDPTLAGGADGLNLKVWILNNMLFEGTMRGLFTLLFGAGVILLTSRLEKGGAGIATADIYYRRILWMLLFGIVNVYIFLWSGDILYPYAIFGLMLFPFRNASVKKLFLVAGILISIGILWDVSDYRSKLKLQKEIVEIETTQNSEVKLTQAQEDKIKEWDKFTTKHTPEEVNELIEKMHQSYFIVIFEKVKENQFMQTWFPYRLWVWDILSYMLIGMAFFKLRIFHGERTNRFYFMMLSVGYLIGLSINYYETKIQLGDNFHALTIMKADQTYQIGRLFTTMGHVGLFMLFIKSGFLRLLQKSLAAVGKLALTNYLMHSIVTSVIFYGDGFSLFGMLERYQLYYIIAGLWIFQLIYSPIYLKYFLFGPAEWIWRSLTYGKTQQFLVRPSDLRN
ncbi:MAG: hypothetical protein CVT92_11105 [Bacteroidetes bacterium HGW-Bacteroidetes-1]|jgi:uncharacterized protein|nr:MAG: hypothetical protein CVT92_11105 [Bacteroidetes bacterium HGW-Bacteroidetes-1]